MRKIIPIPQFALKSIGLAFGLVGEMSQQLYAKAIEPLGVKEHQLFLLTALENLGPQVQPHLSQPLHIDKATMVGLINDLERKELVQRQPHPPTAEPCSSLLHNPDVHYFIVGTS